MMTMALREYRVVTRTLMREVIERKPEYPSDLLPDLVDWLFEQAVEHDGDPEVLRLLLSP
jgi:hypothetical protein